jgi:hypothetical protein
LLKRAVAKGSVWWAIILVLTYSFMLRMPSELFAQYRRELVQETGGRFIYGPIRRKQRLDWCNVMAFCTCGTDPALCLHAWLPVLDEQESGPRHVQLGAYTPTSWTAELRHMLTAEGVPDVEAWFGHDVRRGAAADAFASSGADVMLARGGWRSLAGARPYVPGDEVKAGFLAQNVVDDSDPEC